MRWSVRDVSDGHEGLGRALRLDSGKGVPEHGETMEACVTASGVQIHRDSRVQSHRRRSQAQRFHIPGASKMEADLQTGRRRAF